MATPRHIAGATSALLLALALTAGSSAPVRAAGSPVTCNDDSVGLCARSAHPSPQAIWLIAFGNTSTAARCLGPDVTGGLYGRALFALRYWAQAHQQALPVMDGTSAYLDTLCLRAAVPAAGRAALAGPRFRAFYSRVREQMAEQAAALRDLAVVPTCLPATSGGGVCAFPQMTPAQDASWTARVTDLRLRAYRVHRMAPGTLRMWGALNQANGIIAIRMH